jgi:hypothetical protein
MTKPSFTYTATAEPFSPHPLHLLTNNHYSTPLFAMAIPPSTELSSLCVGSTKNLGAGWLCVFEGTEDECRQYFQNNNVPIEYDHVFMMNRYRQATLRSCGNMYRALESLDD